MVCSNEKLCILLWKDSQVALSQGELSQETEYSTKYAANVCFKDKVYVLQTWPHVKYRLQDTQEARKELLLGRGTEAQGN